MQTRDANTRDFLVGMFVGFVLLLVLVHLGGCATTRDAAPVYVITQTRPTAREPGPVVIRVRIVDTDPSDDVSLSFVYLGARVVEMMRGESVVTAANE